MWHTLSHLFTTLKPWPLLESKQQWNEHENSEQICPTKCIKCLSKDVPSLPLLFFHWRYLYRQIGIPTIWNPYNNNTTLNTSNSWVNMKVATTMMTVQKWQSFIVVNCPMYSCKKSLAFWFAVYSHVQIISNQHALSMIHGALPPGVSGSWLTHHLQWSILGQL